MPMLRVEVDDEIMIGCVRESAYAALANCGSGKLRQHRTQRGAQRLHLVILYRPTNGLGVACKLS